MVDSGFVASKPSGLDALGVFLARSMEGRFVGLEGVSGIPVKLVNIYISCLEGFKRTPEVPVINAGTHIDAVGAGTSVFLVRVHVVDHVELPRD